MGEAALVLEGGGPVVVVGTLLTRRLAAVSRPLLKAKIAFPSLCKDNFLLKFLCFMFLLFLVVILLH